MVRHREQLLLHLANPTFEDQSPLSWPSGTKILQGNLPTPRDVRTYQGGVEEVSPKGFEVLLKYLEECTIELHWNNPGTTPHLNVTDLLLFLFAGQHDHILFSKQYLFI